jgi:hypothetical protein
MRFRLGLLTGFGIGYVLGSKAGRERYEQLRGLWGSVSGSAPAQQLSAEVREAAHRASERIEHKAAEGVARVTELVRGGHEGSDGHGATPEDPG